MVWNIFAWWFNMVERQRDRELHADLHKALYENGFTFQLSFYGTLKKPYDDKHVQARIEVMSRKMFNIDDVTMLYNLFKGFKITKEYEFFILKDGKLFNTRVY